MVALRGRVAIRRKGKTARSHLRLANTFIALLALAVGGFSAYVSWLSDPRNAENLDVVADTESLCTLEWRPDIKGSATLNCRVVVL